MKLVFTISVGFNTDPQNQIHTLRFINPIKITDLYYLKTVKAKYLKIVSRSLSKSVLLACSPYSKHSMPIIVF